MTCQITFKSTAENLTKLESLRNQFKCVCNVFHEGKDYNAKTTVIYNNLEIMGGTTKQVFEKAFKN